MRVVLALILVLVSAACRPMGRPAQDHALLTREFPQLAARARPGLLHAAVIDLDSGELWYSSAERPMPMHSLAVLPIAAAALAEVDAGRLRLTDVVTLTENDLSPMSAIAAAWPARRAFTVRQLLHDAVVLGDNTAADALMQRIGGPGVVSAWLQEKTIRGVRVDRYSRDLQTELAGLPSFDPALRTAPAFLAERALVPEASRRAVMAAHLAEFRDTMSSQAALNFLLVLHQGQLLSPASSALLRQLMTANALEPDRIRAALPAGAILAHMPGTGSMDLGLSPAANDLGYVTLANGRRFAVAIFLAGSTLPEARRDALVADTMRLILRAVGEAPRLVTPPATRR